MELRDDKVQYMCACSLSEEHHMSAHKKSWNQVQILKMYHMEPGDKFSHMHANHTAWSCHRAQNRVDNLQSDNHERMNDHRPAVLSMGVDMKEEVYHKAMEEGLRFFHMHMSNQ
ncbi:hypothetical protein CCACVL1_25786 [Corchorus capsularis]|uniref:Uncharacterized protein n=1 Tax=Corchorus capsularis TaxID=210143 RepID=A0A1R3GH50_COCAP|nr:hypothetical protein CCACVL1_25786 [Corchorus capsularis]